MRKYKKMHKYFQPSGQPQAVHHFLASSMTGTPESLNLFLAQNFLERRISGAGQKLAKSSMG